MMTTLRAWFGRATTAIGFFFASVDLDMLPNALQPVSHYIEDILGHKGLATIMCICFVLSYGRHQWIAMRVKKLEAQGGELPKLGKSD